MSYNNSFLVTKYIPPQSNRNKPSTWLGYPKKPKEPRCFVRNYIGLPYPISPTSFHIIPSESLLIGIQQEFIPRFTSLRNSSNHRSPYPRTIPVSIPFHRCAIIGYHLQPARFFPLLTLHLREVRLHTSAESTRFVVGIIDFFCLEKERPLNDSGDSKNSLGSMTNAFEAISRPGRFR